MTKNAWVHPVAQSSVPKNASVRHCAICGHPTNGAGVIVELLTDHGERLYRAICEADAAHPANRTDVIRTMKRLSLRAS